MWFQGRKNNDGKILTTEAPQNKKLLWRLPGKQRSEKGHPADDVTSKEQSRINAGRQKEISENEKQK